MCLFLDTAGDLADVTHALVTVRLHYCNSRYIQITLRTVWELQIVKNEGSGLLTDVSKHEHIYFCAQEIVLVSWLNLKVLAVHRVVVRIMYVNPREQGGTMDVESIFYFKFYLKL